MFLLQMGRNYIRKTETHSWPADSMEHAISTAIDRNIGLDKTSSQLGVPKSTLSRYVKRKRDGPEIRINKKPGKFKCFL